MHPYSGQLFYDLVHWRDSSNGLVRKTSAEIAFLHLATMALVETVVRIPFCLLAALFAESPKKWLTGEIRSVSVLLSSLYALFINLFVSSLSLRLIQFDIQWRAMQKTELLFLACMSGRADLAKKLLQMGADAHARHEADITPAITPYAFGYPELEQLFRLNSYERDYLELKTLSHWLELSGNVSYPDRPLMLEGTISRWMFDSLGKAFKEYRKSKEHPFAPVLQEALDTAYLEHSYTKIAKRIQKGTLTFVHGEWKKHGICLVFYGNILAIANGGFRGNRSTLELLQIDPSKIRPEIIEEIYAQQWDSPSEGVSYFYERLPAKLSLCGVKCAHPLSEAFKEIAPSHQPGRNCALFSKQTALLFAWSMLHTPNIDQASLKQARAEYKEFIDWTKFHYLETIRPEKKFSRFPKLLEQIKGKRLQLEN